MLKIEDRLKSGTFHNLSTKAPTISQGSLPSLFTYLRLLLKKNGRACFELQTRKGRKKYMRVYHFCGGLCAKVTPFSILPLRPATQALRRVFSPSSRLVRTLMAFSAPFGYERVSHAFENEELNLLRAQWERKKSHSQPPCGWHHLQGHLEGTRTMARQVPSLP